LQEQQQSLPQPGFTQRLTGQCADAHTIALLVDDLNRFYQEKGFITTRVSVPKQNIKTGNLLLKLTPGKVGKLGYADGKPADSRLDTAFPTITGDMLELRKLEQGLDNFNRPPSQSGKFQLVPGKQEGESDILVSANQDKRWRVTTSVDNSGYETTGVTKPSLDFAVDNLLGSNDTLSLGYNTNADREGGNKLSHSANLQYSLPYKDWTLSVGYSGHEFKRVIAGVNQDYRVDGTSTGTTLGLEKLLSRNQTTRHYAYANLAVKESHNYIEGFEILSQQRNLSVLSTGWRGDTKIGEGSLEWKAGGKFGLRDFGAMQEIPGPATPRFSAAELKATLKTPIKGGKLTYTGTLAAQSSHQELPGSEQFGVGGRYDVRGFHEDTLYGNSGVYLRNELETQAFSGGGAKAKFYLGLDAGKVQNPATMQWQKPFVAGAAIGSRINLGKHLEADITYAKALHRPEEFTAAKDQFYFKATWNY
jgi:hemolysin activation/secretion protein